MRRSEEFRKKMSERAKLRIGDKNPFYGKHHTEKTKQILREKKVKELSNPLNHPMYGKHRSEETKRKISETRKRLFKEGKLINPMSHPIAREKVRLSKLGDKNPSKRPEIRKLLSEIKLKSIKEGRSDPIKNIIRNYHIKPNKPETILINLIQKYNLPYKYTGDGSFWIGGINPDFVECNGKKIAIEIFGDYWHNPLLCKGMKWSYTLPGRKELFKKYGWKSVILWQNEIYKDEKYILEKINNGS